MRGYTNCINSQYRKHEIQAKPLQTLSKTVIIEIQPLNTGDKELKRSSKI